MTLARPPPSPQAQAQQLTTVSQDKLNKIKRKLKETIELNESLSKNYLRAKKKIKTLTFERNLLLDRLASMNNSQNETLLLDDDDTDTDNSLNSSHHSGNLISAAAAADDISITAPPPLSRTTATSTLQSSSHISSSRANYHRTQEQNQQQKQQRRVTGDTFSSLGSSSSMTNTTVVSAPPKRSKINRINIKTRRVQPIERDQFGHPKLPQQIGVLTVLNLGTIKTDVDTFHNERYIFPVGYTVKRTYPSMIDPHSNTVITSTILDGGDGSPRFHVVAADQPNEPIVANSATGAWTVVVRKSNEIRHREHSNSASGPDYYGFKHPTIAKMIQDLPGARQLKNYVWQDFEEMEPRAAKGVMAAAEKKRDNLEQIRSGRKKMMDIATVIRDDHGSSSSRSREESTASSSSRAVFEQHYPPILSPHHHHQLQQGSFGIHGGGGLVERMDVHIEEENEEIDELEGDQ